MDAGRGIIIRTLFDPILTILPVFINFWEVETYFHRTFLPYDCLQKLWFLEKHSENNDASIFRGADSSENLEIPYQDITEMILHCREYTKSHSVKCFTVSTYLPNAAHKNAVFNCKLLSD
jgi:hypothetical protein